MSNRNDNQCPKAVFSVILSGDQTAVWRGIRALEETAKTLPEVTTDPQPAVYSLGDDPEHIDLNLSIRHLDLHPLIVGHLKAAGIYMLRALCQQSVADLRVIAGISDRAIDRIRAQLAQLGLRLRQP